MSIIHPQNTHTHSYIQSHLPHNCCTTYHMPQTRAGKWLREGGTPQLPNSLFVATSLSCFAVHLIFVLLQEGMVASDMCQKIVLLLEFATASVFGPRNTLTNMHCHHVSLVLRHTWYFCQLYSILGIVGLLLFRKKETTCFFFL